MAPANDLIDGLVAEQVLADKASFAKLKQYRRIATRYDKLASIMLWLK